GVAGAVIATRASLRTLAENAVHGARAAGHAAATGMKPAFGAARRKFDEVSTLASERLGSGEGDDAEVAVDTTAEMALPPPQLYDVAQEAPERRPRAPRKAAAGALPPPHPAPPDPPRPGVGNRAAPPPPAHL